MIKQIKDATNIFNMQQWSRRQNVVLNKSAKKVKIVNAEK
jgi:hypothetical protein